MILSFKTKINNKPTYFVHKIWCGLIDNNLAKNFEKFYNDCSEMSLLSKTVGLSFVPKIHTIRDDKSDRWERGKIIDFFINARQKNMFRFAPQIPVVSTQTIYMSYAFNDVIEITIDSKYIYDFNEKEELAKNDGFDSYEDFFNYFYPIIKSSENEFYIGKIIHWTKKRY